MEVFAHDGVPVWSWAPDLEDGARRQALQCSSLERAHHHVAVMADGHQGYGVPIGAVLALRDAISPYAVGNDIGCGMAIVPTTLSVDDLGAARDDIMGWVQSTVPSGNATHRETQNAPDVEAFLEAGFDSMKEAAQRSGIALSTSQSPRPDAHAKELTRDDFVRRGMVQLGTLGSGNHFIELLKGPDDDVWVMLHSGSRGVGSAICNNFHRMAVAFCDGHGVDLPDPGLAWLPLDDATDWSRVGECYTHAMQAGLSYAERNRRHMLEAVAAIVEHRFPGAVRWDGIVNIHHNDATLERHYDADVWVHRKGAVKAADGTATITPGSMGTATWIGTGLGAAESFASCSHGAGRVRSRGAARKELSLQHELDTIKAAGGKVFATSKEAVLDEMPGAYKDVDAVMAAQSDLVRAVLRLTPIGTYKGADEKSRRGNRKRWRPEEER